jgi:hypothetical protein
MESKRCISCRWAVPIRGQARLGQCRLNPPTTAPVAAQDGKGNMQLGNWTDFPHVLLEEHYCSHHDESRIEVVSALPMGAMKGNGGR